MSALLYEVKDGIAWIRFNKPEILNAFDADECRHFVKTLKEAAEDKAVKAIILSSVGPAFSAGDDLKAALEECLTKYETVPMAQAFATSKGAYGSGPKPRGTTDLRNVLNQIEALSVQLQRYRPNIAIGLAKLADFNR